MWKTCSPARRVMVRGSLDTRRAKACHGEVPVATGHEPHTCRSHLTMTRLFLYYSPIYDD